MAKKWLTANEVARQVGFTGKAIRDLIKRGDLPAEVRRAAGRTYYFVSPTLLPLIAQLADAHRRWRIERERIVNAIKAASKKRSDAMHG